MSRQESSNTFTEGMIKDLNPINTPNNALTDCVNGTIVTYDGNEHSLQNDKGNYALTNCKLKSNYIPVGIKEYGDILYIVSYNPLDEHVEIGSYPSPERITGSSSHGNIPAAESITIFDKIKTEEGIHKYQDIMERYSKLHVFYGNPPEETKLNPGDEYRLIKELTDTECPFEKLEYFVVDDNRQVYNITDKVKVSSDFAKIQWDIPGWLAVKPTLANLDDLSVNIKKIKVPSYGSGNTSLVLNIRAESSDAILNQTKDSEKYLFAKLNIKGIKAKSTDENSIYSESIALKKKLDIKNGLYYYCSDDYDISGITSEYEILKIEVLPYLQLGTYNGTPVNVYYDALTKNLEFNLLKKGDANNFKIGDSFFNYRTNTNENIFVLNFDTSGLSQSSVLDSDVYLFYTIKDLTGSVISYNDGQQNIPLEKVYYDGWNIVGDTTLELKMNSFTKEAWESNHCLFYPENIYNIEFYIYDNDKGSGDYLFKTSKQIVASELLNSLQDARFDNVPINVWLDKYTQSIQNLDFVVSGTKIGDWTFTEGDSEIYNKWLNGDGSSIHGDTTTYFNTIPAKFEDDLSIPFTKKWNAYCNFQISCTSDLKLLCGPLWIEFLKLVTIHFNGQMYRFDEFTGKIKDNVQFVTEGRGTKSIECVAIQELQGPIWDYDVRNPIYTNLIAESSGVHDHDGASDTVHLKVKILEGSKRIYSGDWSQYWKSDHATNEYNRDYYLLPNKISDCIKNKDFASIKVIVTTMTNCNQYDNMHFGKYKRSNKSWESDLIKNQATGNNKWTYSNGIAKHFLVLKTTEGIMLVATGVFTQEEMPAAIADEKQADFMKRLTASINLVSRKNRKDVGFWTLSLGSVSADPNVDLKVISKIGFPATLPFIYNGNTYNLLKKSDVVALHTKLESEDKLNSAFITTPDLYIFKAIDVQSSNNFIRETIDFPENQEMAFRGEVDRKNSSVREEINSYKLDPYYGMGYPGDGDSYVYVGGTTFPRAIEIVDILNTKRANTSNDAVFHVHHVDNGKHGTVRRRLGLLSDLVIE